MNKQYIFLGMVSIMLYILYRILVFSVQEYKINADIAEIKDFIADTTQYNKDALETIQYKQSTAYKNMILKEQLSLKNKGEKVIYLTTQKNYNKYTIDSNEVSKETKEILVKEYSIIDNMNITEKWHYFLFKKNNY